MRTNKTTLPHVGLALEESGKGDSEGESQEGTRHGDTTPEKDVLDSTARSLVRLNRLASDLGEDDLDGPCNKRWKKRKATRPSNVHLDAFS
jgi:hypothetical protein